MNEHAGVVVPDSVTAKYGSHREIQRALNRRLTTMVPMAAIKECARSLGVWEEGTLAFEEEDDVAVLMDFAIYDYRIRGGTNAVERLVKQAQWAPGSEEQRILDAMLRARFTLLRVSSLVPDVGVQVQDLLYEREFLLADVGLSMTATEGQHIACRVLEFPEFHMTTGATVPLDAELAGSVVGGLRKAFPEGLAAMLPHFKTGDRSKLTAYLMRIALADPDDVKEALPE
jgi:hypothetical protein